MKKVISLILVSSILLVACSNSYESSNSSSSPITSVTEVITSDESLVSAESITSEVVETENSEPSISVEIPDHIVDPDSFSSLSDPDLHDYIEDNIYATLEEELANDDYEVVNVNAIYISQEYIDELAYNSQKNIYFGYTIDEIEAQYGDTPYIFTLGEDGSTTVQVIEASEDHYNEIVRNVAIGTGVILICVTVAVVSGGTLAGPSAAAGTCLINTIFVTAAEGAATYALVNGTISGVAAGIVTGYNTGDYQDAIDAGLYAASEGFMWGAISGAVIGGVSGYVNAPAWMKTPGGHPTWMESEADIILSMGAEEQVSFLAGEEVDMFTAGATRPDGILRNADGTIHAIEIKNYDLQNNLSQLSTELERQVGQRIVDLPAGSTQEIVLDVRGRGYTLEYLEDVVRPYLTEALSDIYPNIPITFFGG